DRPERSPAPPQGAARPPLSPDRRTAAQGRRGRSPRAAVRRLARPSRRFLAAAAGVLGRPQPAGRQPLRPRGKMRAGVRGTGAATAVASLPARGLTPNRARATAGGRPPPLWSKAAADPKS